MFLLLLELSVFLPFMFNFIVTFRNMNTTTVIICGFIQLCNGTERLLFNYRNFVPIASSVGFFFLFILNAQMIEIDRENERKRKRNTERKMANK